VKDLQKYIHLSKYSRWLQKENRRETWEETVQRYMDFWIDLYLDKDTNTYRQLHNAILNKNVMPSMRAMMSAGKALDRDNAAGYNCAGHAINKPRVFDELFYLLMCGCGVGFSVERQYINQLPKIAGEFHEVETTIKVRDSKIGWASGLRQLISLLYAGQSPQWDLSGVRPEGARLKTFGGRASGPAPLDRLFRYTARTFENARGRSLNSLECHDLMCMIADTVIVGSVRRSACISFSNLSDDRMRRAKTGNWYDEDKSPWRALANNAVMYTEKPDIDSFTKEFRSMYRSRAGERSIVNHEALMLKVIQCDRDPDQFYILNPCGEAILRATGGFCNLSEIVARPTDSLKVLKEKTKVAAIIGSLEYTLTAFRYLSKEWSRNAEEERLLGISITGIMDHPMLSSSGPHAEHGLKQLKKVAIKTNIEWAKKLGINPAKQVTLVKPSGTVSLLCDSSSGIHPRPAPHYIRRVTQDKKDPLTDLMIAEGMPHTFDKHKPKVYFAFPIKSPSYSKVSGDYSAMDQLKLWKVYQEYWCDGNPSQTIYYTDDEFLDIQAWIWTNWDRVGGLSFFPKTNHIYENAPQEPISESEYTKLLAEFPDKINWNRLPEFEKKDNTSSSQELACAGPNGCELT